MPSEPGRIVSTLVTTAQMSLLPLFMETASFGVATALPLLVNYLVWMNTDPAVRYEIFKLVLEFMDKIEDDGVTFRETTDKIFDTNDMYEVEIDGSDDFMISLKEMLLVEMEQRNVRMDMSRAIRAAAYTAERVGIPRVFDIIDRYASVHNGSSVDIREVISRTPEDVLQKLIDVTLVDVADTEEITMSFAPGGVFRADLLTHALGDRRTRLAVIFLLLDTKRQRLSWEHLAVSMSRDDKGKTMTAILSSPRYDPPEGATVDDIVDIISVYATGNPVDRVEDGEFFEILPDRQWRLGDASAHDRDVTILFTDNVHRRIQTAKRLEYRRRLWNRNRPAAVR